MISISRGTSSARDGDIAKGENGEASLESARASTEAPIEPPSTDGGSEASGDVEGGDSGDSGDSPVNYPVNYEGAALVELEVDGTDYRLDAGRAGTALCISTRATGSWAWKYRGEARWQANMLRARGFERNVLTRLSSALAEAAAALD